ncbi:Thiosulfate-binding protein [Halomonadaceae bacterium LMG 33818]|uniref:thiosulfate ABC transporter substrate-binding protein CysP n=1 Tax=Cernens ardua TaxID=3402176 RepID=UPI003EDC04E8
MSTLSGRLPLPRMPHPCATLRRNIKRCLLVCLLLPLGMGYTAFAYADTVLTNASFDVSRELYKALNPPFIAQWDKSHGGQLSIVQSHAGSSAQARSVIEGLNADVVTFNQASDIDMIAQAGLIDSHWQQRLPHQSSPYYSTMAFLVRKGNPKHIKTWQDLAQKGVSLVFPNPKTSGNGRYTYLAAWAAEQQQDHNDEATTEAFMRKFLGNVTTFDNGGRGATTSFVEHGVGDVLISFESEIDSLAKQHPGQYDVIIPTVDILAEMPVTWVDANVERNHSQVLAQAYLHYLYTPLAQKIIAEHYYRVSDPTVARQFAHQFPATHLLSINKVFGSWNSILKTHFSSGGKLDQLEQP